MTYTITLTVPEGTTAGAQLVDFLDPGLAFVDVQSVTLSPGVTTANTVGSGTDPANVSVTNAGSALTFNFGNIVNSDTDNTTAQTITIVYRAVVLNTNTCRRLPGTRRGSSSMTECSSMPNLPTRQLRPAPDLVHRNSNWHPDHGSRSGRTDPDA